MTLTHDAAGYERGCRCSRCILAAARSDEARTHGKVSTYNFGCRCDRCRDAAAAHRRRYRAEKPPRARRYPNGIPGRGERYEWQEKASCAPLPTEVFFPHKPDFTQAKAVCADCPVRIECLQFALRTDQPDGVWGGLSFAERQRVLRKRRSA